MRQYIPWFVAESRPLVRSKLQARWRPETRIARRVSGFHCDTESGFWFNTESGYIAEEYG